MGPTRLIAVADASLLVLFARAGRLDLLHGLFYRVEVPPAVKAECVDALPERLDARVIQTAISQGWIRVVAPDAARQKELNARYPDLGAGERQTIALGRSAKPRPILMDDLYARRIAQLEGLEPVGTLGVLARALLVGLEDRSATARILESLLSAGYWVSPDLVEAFWRSVGGRP